MSKENGGPAFPQSREWQDDMEAHASSGSKFGAPPMEGTGMVLRDYFAGLAMQAYCAAESNNLYEKQAADAYKMADAMLIERAK